MKYQPLTYEERVILSTLKLQGLSIRTIAHILGRYDSTLYRELARRRCYKIVGARPSKAQRRAQDRRRRSRRNHQSLR